MLLLARNPALASFFDPSKEANLTGAREAATHPTAYAIPWESQIGNPSIPTLSLPLPEPTVDYTGRVRKITLAVEVAFDSQAVESGEPLACRVSAEQLRDMFIACSTPAHAHEVALVHVELESSYASNVIATTPLRMALDMVSSVPDPQPHAPDALTTRHWFDHTVYHLSTGDNKAPVAHACHILLNHDQQQQQSANRPLVLHSESGRTGIRTFLFSEAVHHQFQGLYEMVGTDRVRLPPPIKTSDYRYNRLPNLLTGWVLERLKATRNDELIHRTVATQGIVLPLAMFQGMRDELVKSVKLGSCLLQHDVTFYLHFVKLTDWQAAYRVPKKSSLVVYLNLYGVVLGH
jgi:hypothetical protein